MAEDKKDDTKATKAPAKKATAKPAAKKVPAKKAETASKKPAPKKEAVAKTEAPKKEAPKKEAAKPVAKKTSKKAKKIPTGKVVKVTQTGSPIGRQDYQEKTLIGLGLNRRHRSKILQDTPAVRGMIEKVKHLVKVEDAA